MPCQWGLASNESPAGLAVVNRRRGGGGGFVEGEMSFRLCEVANYLEATHCKHDVSHTTANTDLDEHCLKERACIPYFLFLVEEVG